MSSARRTGIEARTQRATIDLTPDWPQLTGLQQAVLDGLHALTVTGQLSTLGDAVRAVEACGPSDAIRQPWKTVRALVKRGFLIVLDRSPSR